MYKPAFLACPIFDKFFFWGMQCILHDALHPPCFIGRFAFVCARFSSIKLNYLSYDGASGLLFLLHWRWKFLKKV